MKIENLSAQVKIDGQNNFILIPEEAAEIILMFIAAQSKNGKLQLVKAPNSFETVTLGEALDETVSN